MRVRVRVRVTCRVRVRVQGAGLGMGLPAARRPVEVREQRGGRGGGDAAEEAAVMLANERVRAAGLFHPAQPLTHREREAVVRVELERRDCAGPTSIREALLVERVRGGDAL